METISQSDLVKALARVFPTFAAQWQQDREDDVFPSDSLHSVYQSFVPFLGKHEASETQWVKLASLLNNEVSAGGDRENAVSTCLLEHSYQLGIAKKLRPLLSAEAKCRLHA